MEPGTSREIPTDAGCPKPAGVREETPGEEARGGEGSTGMLKRRGVDGNTEEVEEVEEEAKAQCGDDAEHRVKAGEEEDAGKHEEELDPRIQACARPHC
ncbi:hypothetical protein GBF38_010813 [Nibea albiflora]|uniref:Uncharacterized protein n=1 Tax=Nibea albiflora TaxID=240163 RepID=A0ACB7ET32_NIBAL|nr:hypothetical protein GBF38_010813 [Nibea albiflora]